MRVYIDDSAYRKLRLAAAYYDAKPSTYVKQLLGSEFARLADSNRLLKAAFDIKP